MKPVYWVCPHCGERRTKTLPAVRHLRTVHGDKWTAPLKVLRAAAS